MFKPRTILKGLVQGFNNALSSVITPERPLHSLNMDKVLVISKLSRYEYERRKHSNLNDRELEKELRSRGTDVEKLIFHHNLHKKFENDVCDSFRNMGVEVKVANRFNYNEAKVEWADIIVPTGGDGTFLLASSRVKDNTKPVIGFNSDPNRSEGHLCLPKKYSNNVREAIEKLQQGCFEWLNRSRIRIKLIKRKGDVTPKYLHEIDSNCDSSNPLSKPNQVGPYSFELPVLALNEVFVGEALSARVSHLQLRLNGSTEQTSVKCSGVCVSTGTGSTSWHLSINRLPVQTVLELLKMINVESVDDRAAHRIADLYNKNLIFAPDDKRMGYTIRDLISAGVWPQPKGIKSRGFVEKLEIKSNCYDANLVVDGGVSFDFNDGTIAVLEIRPEDSLRTVVMRD